MSNRRSFLAKLAGGVVAAVGVSTAPKARKPKARRLTEIERYRRDYDLWEARGELLTKEWRDWLEGQVGRIGEKA